MKKHHYITITMAVFALLITIPAVTMAEDGNRNTANIDVTAQADTEVRTSPIPRPGLPVPAIIRNVLRAKTENIKDNEEARNKLLENRKVGTTTPPRLGIKEEREDIRDDRREEVGEIRKEGRDDMRSASSSEDRREVRKDMRLDIFKVRKEAMIKQLNLALNNLRQIRDRISSRIDKAVSEGRDMDEAKSLLIVADGKITLAQQTVDALLVFNPTATSTASTTIDLAKPREAGENAIKAVKKAHEALVAVVRAIAHAMGLGNATSTPPTTTITAPAPENTSTVNPPVDNQ